MHAAPAVSGGSNATHLDWIIPTPNQEPPYPSCSQTIVLPEKSGLAKSQTPNYRQFTITDRSYNLKSKKSLDPLLIDEITTDAAQVVIPSSQLLPYQPCVEIIDDPLLTMPCEVTKCTSQAIEPSPSTSTCNLNATNMPPRPSLATAKRHKTKTNHRSQFSEDSILAKILDATNQQRDAFNKMFEGNQKNFDICQRNFVTNQKNIEKIQKNIESMLVTLVNAQNRPNGRFGNGSDEITYV